MAKNRKHRSPTPESPVPSRRKVWAFRLLALLLAPVILFGGLELGLRLGGYGYDTNFFRAFPSGERALLVPNNQFGWRFFGPELSRWPYPFAIAPVKATNTVRIFVLGESAARGEPQPGFGLPRMLAALLSLRFPHAQFEVVNVAMTAINSHTILPIARDCAAAEGDIWVIYMGNNEVVGPFGAGTIFGPQTPPLPLVRANLALKSTRSGQLIDATYRRLFAPDAAQESLWGGMGMFLEQQVSATDARMPGVYHHFRENLSAIIGSGQRSGAGVVVGTVAVNLKDCPPFASMHRPDLTSAERANWEQHYEAGRTAYAAENYSQAADRFAAATQIDDTFAALAFQQGECALKLENTPAAREFFTRARDLDTLRFRCDSRLNEIVRQTIQEHTNARTRLVDCESDFAALSEQELPGRELFYEHVHLTFAGNYHLARLFAEQIEALLPDWITTKNSPTNKWPTLADCAARLGYSAWHEFAALNSILTTVQAPPFTGRPGHQEELRALQNQMAQLASAQSVEGIAAAIRTCETALASNPTDAVLHRQLAALRRAHGDWNGAVTAAKAALELLPNDPEAWSVLSSALVPLKQIEAAEQAARNGFALGPQTTKSKLELAQFLAEIGKPESALTEYQRILDGTPDCLPALLQMGQVLEKQGRASEAKDYFQRALASRRPREPELVDLGEFFLQRGDFETALTLYREAIQLNPSAAKLHLAAGRCLAMRGRYDEALQSTSEAVRLSPEWPEARQLHGIVLLKRGQRQPAIEQFQIALRLDPDSLEAHLNLGVALAQAGRQQEAIPNFTAVLARDPKNAQALKFFESLRIKP